MFICSMIIIFILSKYFFQDWDLDFQIVAAISIGLAVTMAEAISYKGSDNLTIPIIAFLFIELFNQITVKKKIKIDGITKIIIKELRRARNEMTSRSD